MPLDASLFTLTFQRRVSNATILDLIPFKTAAADAIASTSTQPEPLYSFLRARSNAYNVQLQDHLTSMPLASINAPSSSDKIRQIILYNPDDKIIMDKKAMTFKQEWRWKWQEQEFQIRKEGRSFIVEALRKPDPEIDIARYTPRSKTRPAFLQMLDYNIQRLEVDDRRGLEMIILMAVCTLLDAEYDEKYKDGPVGNIYLPGYTPFSAPSLSASSGQVNPPSSSDITTQSYDVRAEPNEIYIDMYIPNEMVTQQALKLLRQDQDGQGLHLIILKANDSQVAPKAVQIAADIKARWYRLEPIAKGRTLDPLPGSKTEIAEELYQYVRDPSVHNLTRNVTSSTVTGASGRPRIKLDPPSKDSALSSISKTVSTSPQKTQKASFLPPPNQLDIYLSKEKLDEFEATAAILSSNSRVNHYDQSQKPNPVTPSIPPKKQTEIASHENTGRKILGKLGIRKALVNNS